LSGYAGRVGDSMVVRAYDDFQVTRVLVVLSEASGNAIDAERGASAKTSAGSGRWTLRAVSSSRWLAARGQVIALATAT